VYLRTATYVKLKQKMGIHEALLKIMLMKPYADVDETLYSRKTDL
jgi:hypothetical protein